ncbi:MAG: lipopolysaccharide heptosyltransferase I [Gallionella sp.]|nr:lipopolysaccharide heptosyltransferase I [Gallionella sp.]MDH4286395.1 lipopolysaccharide heptosyltransferase I [Gallionella sp.]
MAPLSANTPTPHILLVKTSSLGDVLHNLPVVSDIVRHYPNAQIDWIVEESFAALPRLHPAVRNVIPVAVRRWRGKLFSATTWRDISAYRSLLAAQHYDVAIDTQGLLKSAMLMLSAQGLRCGFDRSSAREPLAASLYQRTFPVAPNQHAVERNRQLAAQALGYALEECADYGIRPPALTHPAWPADMPYAVLLHATSRAEKLWKETNWIALGCYLREKDIRCILPWGSDAEQARSLRLAKEIPDSITPPRLNLNEAAALLGGAQAVIGVDTGLAHLAAALGVPTVGIYTATDPALTGLYAGRCAVNLGNIACAPDVSAVIDALRKATVC